MPNTDEYIGVVISDVARLLRTEFDRRVHRLERFWTDQILYRL